MNSLGKMAEMQACNYLRRQNYKLIASNYRSKFGEIDLIMSKGKYLCFIEVKMRNENSIAEPREFVDEKKQEKIIATAKIYLANHKTRLQPRFDVIEVICEKGNVKTIKHLENAFTL